MKLSIIIPMYNAEKYIKKCIDSILNQIDDTVELILVNDGSIDSTETICKSYKSKQIKYFYIKNHGVSYARNYGLKYALGEYIMFVDSDDCWKENTFLQFKNNVKNNFDLIIFEYTKYYKNKLLNVNFPDNLKENNIVYNIFYSDSVAGFLWNKIFKKSIIEDNKIEFNVNVNFSEDLMFVCDYVKFVDSNKIMYIYDSLYLYRIRKSGVSINFYSAKNQSIINAYEYLIEKFNGNDNILNKIKEDYLFSLRKFGVNNSDILLEEKFVFSNMSFSKKVKYILIKRFRKLYIFIRNMYYKNNKNLFE